MSNDREFLNYLKSAYPHADMMDLGPRQTYVKWGRQKSSPSKNEQETIDFFRQLGKQNAEKMNAKTNPTNT